MKILCRLAFVFVLHCCFAQAEPVTAEQQSKFGYKEDLSTADSEALVEYEEAGIFPFALAEYQTNEAAPSVGVGITLNRKLFGKSVPILELRLPEDSWFLGIQFNKGALSRNAKPSVQKFDPASFGKEKRIFLVQLQETDFVEDKNNDESLLHIEIALKGDRKIWGTARHEESWWLRAFRRDPQAVAEKDLAKRKNRK
jgi:hypothetical protein